MMNRAVRKITTFGSGFFEEKPGANDHNQPDQQRRVFDARKIK